MSRILVTGGAGFMGSWLVDELIARGHEVTSADDLSGGFMRNVSRKCRFVKMDLRDSKKVDSVVRGQEIICHLAAYAAEGQSVFSPREINDINITPMNNLLVSAVNHGVRKFVFTSSMAVYGDQKPPFSEDMPTVPEDPYGVGKAYCERMLQIFSETYGFRHVIIRPHNCYDRKTEILTSSGFKPIKDVSKSDLIATLNPGNGALEYHHPTDTQKIRFNGHLFNFRSKSYDLMVTPDHKIWCKRTPRSRYCFVEARHLAESKTSYSARLSCYADNWNGKDKEFYEIPEIRDSTGRKMDNSHQKGHPKKIPMDKWVEFLGWYISEGCRFKTPKNYVVSISQYYTSNRDKFSRIASLAEEMGFHPYFTGDRKEIRIFSKQLYYALGCLMEKGAENKKIPKEFKELSKRYLKILYETLMKGDGSLKPDGSGKYTTKSQQLADDFCELLLKIGKSGTVSYDGSCFKISVTEKNAPQMGDNRTKKIYIKKVPYNDFVYDVTVPNHIIFVRRNGKACWSSNCYGPRQNISDPYRNVLGIWINNIMRGKPPYIYGDGKQTRAFSYVEDINPALANAAEWEKADGNAINLGSHDAVSINDACRLVLRLMGSNMEPVYLEERPCEVKHAHCTTKKSEKLLAYRTNHTLEQGLVKMIKWARQVGQQKPSYRIPLEIEKRAPKVWRERMI